MVWAVTLAVLRLFVVLPERCPSPAAGGLRAAAAGTVDWFATNQRTDGRWLYLWREDGGETAAPYSIVRHAGVTMALYQAAAAGFDAALPVADQGTAYALRRLVPTGTGASAFALREEPVQTGATALLAAGLVERREALGDDRHDRTLVRLGRFLAGQVEPGGAVAAYWSPATEAPVPGQYSKYYTGEAFWALGQLASAFPGEGFEEAAAAAGRYIATERDDAEAHFPPVPDHWAGYGLDDLERVSALGEAEVAYARRLAGLLGVQARGESQRRADGWARLVRGSFARAGGLGTLGEGLGGLWRLAGRDARLAGERATIGERILCVAGMLTDRQVRPPAEPEVAGAWISRGETRMDDQQHGLSSLLAALDVLAERGDT